MGMPISDSKKYQLAGNSIVVNCLYLLFKNMFVNPTFGSGRKIDKDGQLSLF